MTTSADEKVRKVELLISTLLRVGVMISLTFVVAGTVLSFSRHHDYTSSEDQLHRLTSPGAAFPRTLHEVVRGVKDLRGQAIVVVGLLLLIATPVLRVAVSVFAFIYERDFVFVAVTLTVLILLILSFVLGRAEG